METVETVNKDILIEEDLNSIPANANLSFNEHNSFSISELEYIRQIIENMDKHNQIQILKLVHETLPNCINENKYGCKINMIELNDELIEKINNYIEYVNYQEKCLKKAEKEKEKYINNLQIKN